MKYLVLTFFLMAYPALSGFDLEEGDFSRREKHSLLLAKLADDSYKTLEPILKSSDPICNTIKTQRYALKLALAMIYLKDSEAEQCLKLENYLESEKLHLTYRPNLSSIEIAIPETLGIKMRTEIIEITYLIFSPSINVRLSVQ
ncbi:MAG: hypothetical protein KC505_02305 [Myxococcales bacterium]|nr:hypothetical protein [Myxococcales bacterium]USN51245.1 MAG: hypothetical protein H6731_02230 [Myxococcales bacterium]